MSRNITAIKKPKTLNHYSSSELHLSSVIYNVVSSTEVYEMFCAIWYQLHNMKDVKLHPALY